MTTKTEAAKALVLERTYHAPVARVWKALTDVDQMRASPAVDLERHPAHLALTNVQYRSGS